MNLSKHHTTLFFNIAYALIGLLLLALAWQITMK